MNQVERKVAIMNLEQENNTDKKEQDSVENSETAEQNVVEDKKE